VQLDVVGSNIHAPLVERLIELPMDISGGRLDGDFHLRSHDAKTWHFPAIDGRLRHGNLTARSTTGLVLGVATRRKLPVDLADLRSASKHRWCSKAWVGRWICQQGQR